MINFLCSSPVPIIDGSDAVYSEIAYLKAHFDGKITSLYPFRKPSSTIPDLLYGLHNLRSIRKHEKTANLNHIYTGKLMHLPFLYTLKKPTVYTIVSQILKSHKIPPEIFTNSIDSFIVSDKQSLKRLNEHGIKRAHYIKPGIDLSKLELHKKESNGKINILMASAPWELKQFESKGIHLILDALRSLDGVHITFLWRKLHSAKMLNLITEYDVQSKISFIDKNVDINLTLKTVHAAILLANDSSVIKTHPHSLMESLATGKPVITSKEIPISNFVKENNCGMVLEEFSRAKLIQLIQKFKDNLPELTQNAQNINQEEISIERMRKEYEKVYNSIKKKSIVKNSWAVGF